MMNLIINGRSQSVIDFCREEWNRKNNYKIDFRIHRCHLPQKEYPKALDHFDIEENRVIIFQGAIEYNPSPKVVLFKNDNQTSNVSLHKLKTSEGLFILIIREQNSFKKSEIQNLISLLSISIGFSFIGEKIASGHVDIERDTGSNKIKSRGNIEMKILEGDFYLPNYSPVKKELVKNRWRKINGLSKEERSRCSNGLFFYAQSIEYPLVPSFLSIWTAIECVSIIQGTNIIHVKNDLSSIYKIDKSQIDEEFQLGKIFGVRSNIVHNGTGMDKVSESLILLLRSIFSDLLQFKIGEETGFQSRSLVSKIKPSLQFLFDSE